MRLCYFFNVFFNVYIKNIETAEENKPNYCFFITQRLKTAGNYSKINRFIDFIVFDFGGVLHFLQGEI